MTTSALIQLVDANDVNPDGIARLHGAVRPALRLDRLGRSAAAGPDFGFFATNAGLDEIATYADGIGPWKRYIVSTGRSTRRRRGVGDENGDGNVDEADRVLLPPTDLISGRTSAASSSIPRRSATRAAAAGGLPRHPGRRVPAVLRAGHRRRVLRLPGHRRHRARAPGPGGGVAVR